MVRKDEVFVGVIGGLIGVPDVFDKVALAKVQKLKMKYPYKGSVLDRNCQHLDFKMMGDGVFRCLDCGFEWQEI